MATILLQPGEVFEHYHSEPSLTVLVQGTVEAELTGQVVRLEPGKPLPVPAKTPHSITNIGAQVAEVSCVGTGATLQHRAPD